MLPDHDTSAVSPAARVSVRPSRNQCSTGSWFLATARKLASRASDAEPALVRVAGRHCESGDIVVDAEWLPVDVAPGDLLAVAATGAYCHSLASNYNAAPRPPVLAVSRDADGAPVVRTLVRRESIDDLLARDAGLDTPGAESA